jgi:membrane protein involved in colicin uptake
MEILAKEKWRIERIEKAARLAAQILDMDAAQLSALVKSVDDIHGHLQVRWKHPMTGTQVRAFSLAWSMCGEPAENVDHRVSW